MASIKKYKDGRYHTQIYLGKDASGKRKTISIAGHSEKEVRDKRDSILNDIRIGIDVMSSEDIFSAWAEKWLANKKTQVGNNDYQYYYYSLRRVNDILGQAPLSKIQTRHIQDMINLYAEKNPTTGKPTAKRTLKCYRDICAQVFDYAIMNRAVVFNPAKYVTIPRDAAVTKRRVLTENEIAAIDICEHRMKIAAMLMLYAGLRKGEVIALQWKDINLKDRYISVTKSVEFIGKDAHIKPPKTKAGNRQVYICTKLWSYLSTKVVTNVDEYVSQKISGGIHTKNSFRKAWDSYILAISGHILPTSDHLCPQKWTESGHKCEQIVNKTVSITPHMLRHTFCTMLHENGVDIKTAQQQMGHSDTKTTLDVYTHVTSQFELKEMQKMDILD